MRQEILEAMMVGNTYAMMVEGQFMDFDFEDIELKKIGSKYLYFEYLGEDNWMHKKGCKIKYEIKYSCAWVEGSEYKEECYESDSNTHYKPGYKVNQEMKGKCFMCAVLFYDGKVMAGDKSIFGI